MSELEYRSAEKADNFLPKVNWDAVVEPNSKAERSDAGSVELKDGRVIAVNYPDGRKRAFEYDNSGSLVKIVQPSGEIWTRNGASGKWVSNQGNQFAGKIEVETNGDYKTTDVMGLTRTYRPNGWKLLGEVPVESVKSFLKDCTGVADLYHEALPKIDLDHNGVLDDKELSRAMSSKELSGAEKLLATSLKAVYLPLGPMDWLPGISAKDMDWFYDGCRYTPPRKWADDSPEMRSTWRTLGGFGIVGGTAISLLGMAAPFSKSLILAGAAIALGNAGALYWNERRYKEQDAMLESHRRIQKMIDGVR